MIEEILLLYCSDYSVARFGKRRKEFPPLGVLYLAAACEEKGIKVVIKDLATMNSVPSYKVIGLSIGSSYIYPAFKKRINEIRAQCEILLVGGQHSTLYPKETLIDLNADYVLIGEGELSLPAIISACYAVNLKDKCIQRIANVYCANNIDTAKYSEKNRILDLDYLAFPARHLLPKEDIVLESRIPYSSILSTNVITSRGCPYGCRFCGNLYKGFAFRSAENVEREIRLIIEEYPEIGGIVYLDENLFFRKQHALDILSCMKKFNLKWTCNARVDGFTQELLPQTKHCGCVEIKYGIESGSQRILDNMRKGISVDTIEKTLRSTVENGIHTKCFLMFGYPGDNIESAKETIEFLERNRNYVDRVNLFSFSPVPNSPIYKSGQCAEYSWEDYKIYRQLRHWWGNEEQYMEVKAGYKLLQEYILTNYGDN